MSSGPPPGPPPGMMGPGYGPPPGFPGQGFPPPGQGFPGQYGAPPPPMAPTQSQAPLTAKDTIGSFEGVQYRIDHRDSNSILHLTLQPGYTVKGKPGSMVTMSGSVQIKGAMKFSLSKMISGGEMSESQFTGPGEVLLAPEIWGDIIPIRVNPNESWSVGKDAFLGATPGITRSTKSQGFMKGLMSGEGFFVAKVQGQGILFVQSLGAIIQRDLGPNDEWIVDNGHLVAWSASYSMERIKTTGGGMFSASHTGEGMVCRFKGPGTIYIQTRNPESLTQWIAAQLPSGSRGGGGGGGGGNLMGALLSG